MTGQAFLSYEPTGREVPASLRVRPSFMRQCEDKQKPARRQKFYVETGEHSTLREQRFGCTFREIIG
jgi:hypothetical protein